MTQPQVELLFWEGCPSHPQALAQLREAMEELGLDAEAIEVRHVDTDERAGAERFVGSPTIRIDGVDIQDPGDEPTALTCRVYHRRDGRISAVPDPADVRDALHTAITTRSRT
jgi:8-oxo-dGTP pyrophosphatase MutT (NUDIX family)